jgi:DNA-binding NtrC family response regulator
MTKAARVERIVPWPKDSAGSHDLPLSEERRAAAKRNTILVFEDDPKLLPLKQEILEGEGYKVYGFSLLHEALECAQSNVSIDLLLADVQWDFDPSIIHLAEWLAEVKPCVPVLLMSGGVMDGAQMQVIRARSWTFVNKPLRVPVLLSIIESLLDASPDSVRLR